MKFIPYTSAADTLIRDRLIDSALSGSPGSARTALLVAPGGYGKTTLLYQIREVMVKRGIATVWLNCQAEDAALDIFHANLNDAFHDAGLTDKVSDYDVSNLIRILSEKKTVAFFLDEYENASSEGCDNVLEQLIRTLPEQCYFFVATRELPRVGVSKLLLDGHARIISAMEMRFNEDETKHIIADVNLNQSHVKLVAQSEGWPVMLQLAKLDAQNSESISIPVTPYLNQAIGIFDYLAEQILSKLTPVQRDFLLELSILTEIDVEVAQAVIASPDAEKILYELLHLQPIITIIVEKPLLLRLHPLIRDFLRHESVKYTVTSETDLHERAARHFAGSGNVSKAIHHATLSNSNELVADIAEQAGGALLNVSEGYARVRSFLSALPPSFITQRPRLYLMHIMQQATEGSSAEWVAEFEHFTKAFPNQDDELALQSNLVRAIADVVENRRCLVETPWKWIDEMRKICLAHKFEEPRYLGLGLPIELIFVIDYGSLTLADQRMDELTELFTSENFAPNFSWLSNNMSSINLTRGDLAAAAFHAQSCLDRLQESGEKRNTLIRQQCNAILGQCYFDWNELDLALAYFSKVNKRSAYSQISTFVLSVCTWARILVLEGKRNQALTTLEDVYAFTVKEKLPHFRIITAATIAEFLLIAGNLDGCREWIAREELENVLEKCQLWFTRPWLETETLVRLFTLLWSAQNKLTQAHDIAHEFAVRARQSGRQLMAARTECLLVEVALKQKRRRIAQAALDRALESSELSQALRLFLELSPAALSMLRSMRKKGHKHADQIDVILSARASVPPHHLPTADHVSPREREVLIGLGQGQSTKIIARKLNLSYETVRHHLKNIFSKLDVHSQQQAVEEARQRNIIS